MSTYLLSSEVQHQVVLKMIVNLPTGTRWELLHEAVHEGIVSLTAGIPHELQHLVVLSDCQPNNRYTARVAAPGSA